MSAAALLRERSSSAAELFPEPGLRAKAAAAVVAGRASSAGRQRAADGIGAAQTHGRQAVGAALPSGQSQPIAGEGNVWTAIGRAGLEGHKAEEVVATRVADAAEICRAWRLVACSGAAGSLGRAAEPGAR